MSGAERSRASTLWPLAAALLIIGTAYAICYVGTIQTKPLFAPDSRYYAAMALWYGGGEQQDIARQVAEYSAQFGWASPGPDQLLGWGLVQPRVVLPALSIPFVAWWGIPGLAVVPGIALALLVIVLTVMLTRRYGVGPALAAMLLLVASSQFMFFGAAMLTEGLSALWTTLTLIVALRYFREPSRWGLVLMGLLTLVSAFTRQATLIVAGAFVVAWFAGLVLRRPERWGWPALVVAVTSVGCQVLQTRFFPFSQTNQFLAKTESDSLGEAVLNSPHLAWYIIKLDVIQALGADRALLVLVALALLSMVVLWRRTESHLLLGALLGAGLYNITNGTPTGIRYAMPGIVFFVLSVAALVACAMSRGTGVREDALAPEVEAGTRPGEKSSTESGAEADRELAGS